jgi:hypothetical protein
MRYFIRINVGLGDMLMANIWSWEPAVKRSGVVLRDLLNSGAGQVLLDSW